MNEVLEQFNVWSVFDILIIAYIIYNILLLIRGTRAAQMLAGILIFVAAFLFSSIVPLSTLNWVMNKFYSSFIIILVIIFQEDIRRVLSRIGKKSILPPGEQASPNWSIDEITRASVSLARKKKGALIVIERNIRLDRYSDLGIQLDARIAKELLISIFQTTSPIHDGAVIIQGDRISAAACFLPIRSDEYIDQNLGTRHRAALGISQETDAVVVVVSEEKGTVSIALEGRFLSNLTRAELRTKLYNLLLVSDSSEPVGKKLSHYVGLASKLFSRK